MTDGTFTKGFDTKIMFHAQIPWDFPPKNRQEMRYVYNILFKTIFEKPKQMIISLARALAGTVAKRKFYFCPGSSDSGKSILIKILRIAFGKYIGNFNARSLTYASRHNIEWAFSSRYCRILLSNEPLMKKKLYADSIKKHSSEDVIVGKEINFVPHYTVFCMMDDIPQIELVDQSVTNRLGCIEFPYVFVAENKMGDDPRNKLKDPDLGDKVEDEAFVRGFIHLLLHVYIKYQNMIPI